MVARGPFRDVHRLGRLLGACGHVQGKASGRRRVDSAQLQDSAGGVQGVRQAVQSGEIRPGRLGGAGRSGGDEIHGHHLEAPRWLRPVRLEGEPLERGRGHALWQGPHRPVGRGRPKARPEVRPLLLPGPGLDQSRRRQVRVQGRRRLGRRPQGKLRQVPGRSLRSPGPRDPGQLQARHPVVGHGGVDDARTGQEVRSPPDSLSGDHHE